MKHSKEGQIIHVMIASPSDLSDERRAVERAINKWNWFNTIDRSVVLLPLMWEHQAYPDQGAPAQEKINQQLLSRSNMLIALFKNRLGTPTENYESGTAEEIALHLEKDKHVSIYFSSINDANDLEEKQRLNNYRDKMWKTGLGHEFGDANTLESDVYDHLSLIIPDKFSSVLEKNVIKCGIEKKMFDLIASMSDQARELLLELFHDRDLRLMRVESPSYGYDSVKFSIISVNDRKFSSQENNALDQAWRFLFDKDLILLLSENCFTLSAKGYVLANMLIAP
jgi:hypothetical protein